MQLSSFEELKLMVNFNLIHVFIWIVQKISVCLSVELQSEIYDEMKM